MVRRLNGSTMNKLSHSRVGGRGTRVEAFRREPACYRGYLVQILVVVAMILLRRIGVFTSSHHTED